MHTIASRAAHWSRAFLVAALAAVGACSDDDPVAPKMPRTPNAAVRGADAVEITVTNTSGGTEVGSLRWAAKQVELTGGLILIDSTLGGKTITLDAGLDFKLPTSISGPPTGITISGKDQFRLILARSLLVLENVTLTKGNWDAASAVWARQLDMYHTTITGNRGADGVIYVLERAEIANSTISGNTTSRAAVLYSDYAKLWFGNSTIAFNAAGGIGPYAFQGGTTGPITLENSIISNNGGRNCVTYHGLDYVGTNIVNDWSCADAAITPSDPKLMPLANNGGPNMTHAIPHTSPAYNAGVGCYFGYEDQRHVKRDAACDVGAFEFNDFTKVAITVDNGVKVSSTTGKAMLTGTVKCTRADAFTLLLELHQDQKINGEIVDVHSVSSLPVQCATSAKAWSVPMELIPGEAFQAGAAKAIVATFNNETPEWVTPASVTSGVRISVSRK